MLYEDKIINNYENKHIKKFIKNTHINKNINHFNSSSINYYIVEDINKLKNVKDKDFNVIYAPSEYKIPVILDAIKYIKERYNKKPYIYLPVVANFRDLDVINKILANFPPNEIGIAAGSLYGIYYADKYDVIAMQNNNVANNYTADVLLSRGVKNFVSSIETNLFDNINSGYKYIGAPPLMTLVMCPFIENCKSECGKCIYNSKYTLVMDDGTELKIRRSKLSDCFFDLYFNKKITIPSGNGYVIDLRD